MTIEQEFFEAMEVEPTPCKIYRCKQACGADECVYFNPIEKNYPPITPEIVLGLEEIILQVTEGFELQNNKYAYIAMLNTDGGYWRLCCSGDTRQEALLKLCIELKDEIQDQVKALFNEL